MRDVSARAHTPLTADEKPKEEKQNRIEMNEASLQASCVGYVKNVGLSKCINGRADERTGGQTERTQARWRAHSLVAWCI